VRILLTRLSALGDIVHTWPLVEALATGSGNELAWLVEEPLAPLVASHPGVSRTITLATRRWRRYPAARGTRDEISATFSAISSFAPDVALDPQGLWKSAVWAARAGVPRRIGLPASARRERLCGIFYTEVTQLPDEISHVIDFNLSLLEPLGIVSPYGAIPDGKFLVAAAARPPWLPAQSVSFLPTTGGSGKAWRPEAFVQLAGRLGRAGRAVTVLWGPGEENVARSIASAAEPPALVAPPTSLFELAVALRHSAVVVGGDTGPVHMAAALGTPTVAIMVATDALRNGVRGRRVAVLDGAVGRARHGRARTRQGESVPLADVERAVLGFLPAAVGDRATMIR
jgi:lipopolysaccharide heptosyltransferase I